MRSKICYELWHLLLFITLLAFSPFSLQGQVGNLSRTLLVEPGEK
jgi:hypothetical protein